MGPNYAGFGSRLGAFLIDIIVFALISAPASIPAQIFRSKSLEDCSTVNGSIEVVCGAKGVNTGYQALYWAFTLLALVLGAAVYGFWVGRGQTPGMRVAHVKIVDSSTGHPIGTGRAVGRYFARIISFIPCLLGFFWMLWDKNKQTWHDKMVRSYAIKV
jgi:uncharacterized RDD family membrane protein YckC